MSIHRTGVTLALVLGTTLVAAGSLSAEDASQPPRAVPASPRHGTTIGVQGFGSFGVTVPVAAESLSTVGLTERPHETGGGAQVTGLWRGLFVQVAASRWKDAGSRVFVDSRGNTFDLGIPLRVRATHVDVGAGWRFERWGGSGALGPRIVPYAGGGVGVLEYEETSDFAESRENVAERVTTYAVFGGVEVRLARWVGVAADVRYRFVAGILGTDGVSAMRGDDSLRGPSASVRVLVGRFGSPRRATSTPTKSRTEDTAPSVPTPNPASEAATPAPHVVNAPSEAAPAQPEAAPATPPSALLSVIGSLVRTIASAPVRIAPDAQRQPLAVLEPGTRVRVLAEAGEWLRVEFSDRRWGPRVGYIERKDVLAAADPP